MILEAEPDKLCLSVLSEPHLPCHTCRSHTYEKQRKIGIQTVSNYAFGFIPTSLLQSKLYTEQFSLN